KNIEEQLLAIDENLMILKSNNIETVASILKNFCNEMDAVAVPGFGTFQPVKENEMVIAGEDGSSTLLPPAIEVKFKSSVILRKALGK
ncbi:MAG: hypothetical protein K2K52_06195, partial [Paramuribaculum sp.]|nr:hypothetical protein [Paramuribaculum sp.]